MNAADTELSATLKNWLPKTTKDEFTTLAKVAVRLIDGYDPLLLECFAELICAKLARAKLEVAEAENHEDQVAKMREVVDLRNFLREVSGFHMEQKKEAAK